MLFYIFLFGISRDGHHQAAWAKSFGMWLVMEILLVSSVMVLVMNVLIPLLTMKDLKQIRMKLIDTIVQYNQRIHTNAALESEEKVSETFNAAKFLFVSYRLAETFPDLRVSKVILAYETPWPRQSYLRTGKDLTQSYNRKFAAIYQAAMMMLIQVFSTFVASPAHLQDMAMQIVSTVLLGYTILMHVKLYQIFPVLVIIPTIVIFMLGYTLFRSTWMQERLKTLQLLHVDENTAQKEEEQRRSDTSSDNVSNFIKSGENSDELSYDNKHSQSHVDATFKPEVALDRRGSIQYGFSLLNQGQGLLTDGAISNSKGVASPLLPLSKLGSEEANDESLVDSDYASEELASLFDVSSVTNENADVWQSVSDKSDNVLISSISSVD
jgi:hypothetical protein